MKKILLMTFVAVMAFATSSCIDEHEDYLITYGIGSTYFDYDQESRAAISYLLEVFDETFQNAGYEVIAGNLVLRDSSMKKASKIAKDLANKADSKVDPTKIEVLKTMESLSMRVRVNSLDSDEEVVWEKDYAKE